MTANEKALDKARRLHARAVAASMRISDRGRAEHISAFYRRNETISELYRKLGQAEDAVRLERRQNAAAKAEGRS
jgi:hypothetical protein